MNFFDAAFQTPISATAFGLCDNGTGGLAYADCENPASWIATARNPNADTWVFTAIDKGVVTDNEFSGKGRCDGMLTREMQKLILVELKDQKQGWIPTAIRQLEDTMALFRSAHPTEWTAFLRKSAYACNRHHPHFQNSQKDAMQRFFKCYRVRLHIEATLSL